ncbi:RING-H2 finger protein ATL56-like isoform X6 [Phoenix dactylifera]|uniref:RING-H2 finger protein ATL56-like isoform X6 n=1 Tax=Phoenix dactylifera TaxID=42345 RepID=A0A8B7BND4_PHODC|nr:RING-H2 finger protein ATL56-like isoform X6 [Phoenix dactylifera]
MPRFDRDRSISAPPSVAMHPHQAPAKPKGGARVLSFVLQAIVMAVALALFFLFAGVAAVVLLHLCVAGRALRRRRLQSRSLHPADSAAPVAEPSGLSPADLRKIRCFEYGGGSASLPWPPDCAVCLEGFRKGERCRALPGCGHAFHAPCIDRWLVRSPACPICRRGVAAAAVVPDRMIRRPVGWA